jgi:hypothetical protein
MARSVEGGRERVGEGGKKGGRLRKGRREGGKRDRDGLSAGPGKRGGLSAGRGTARGSVRGEGRRAQCGERDRYRDGLSAGKGRALTVQGGRWAQCEEGGRPRLSAGTRSGAPPGPAASSARVGGHLKVFASHGPGRHGRPMRRRRTVTSKSALTSRGRTRSSARRWWSRSFDTDRNSSLAFRGPPPGPSRRAPSHGHGPPAKGGLKRSPSGAAASAAAPHPPQISESGFETRSVSKTP